VLHLLSIVGLNILLSTSQDILEIIFPTSHLAGTSKSNLPATKWQHTTVRNTTNVHTKLDLMKLKTLLDVALMPRGQEKDLQLTEHLFSIQWYCGVV